MLLDSFAWMEYFMGTQEGEKVRRFVDDDIQLYTSPIVIAEIYSKSLRTDGNAEERKDFIIKRCALIVLDEIIAVEAAKIHAEKKIKTPDFGLADALILASARNRKIKVVTGDPHFKDFKDAVMM
ncbi:MAG: PIN domain-containing protein [Methanosarcinales archaeon]|jgi:predicted nucleic acid-binding protein|nr:type II toxin-antitoxin system VapC family toxin [ANME-2 cluster archaeon]MBC2762793.1 type II toxin-antitoxin system VapC family toxin [ANME-2 cluster archaeon]MCD4842323.1 PIN domain-containing protein [Methanosarcinales archaeon]